jgi:putative endonuclease
MEPELIRFLKLHMAEHNKIGVLGEEIAAGWLKSHGFSVIERNYRQKWGEIDAIALKNKHIHFVEVKTVSYETRELLDYFVSRETWQPEELVHERKLQRLGRAIETWLAKHRFDGVWQIDVLTVRVVPREKYAKVKHIENVILE